jgi:topoisomerase-4 subunit A
MTLIEKYDPEKVYTVVHLEGKSKNYMVKRFKFENTAIGKQTSIISEESGSKLALISGAKQPKVTVDQLKGKTEIPETVELDLSEMIDVKGMKAMGNRVSQHTVKTVKLITQAEPEPVEEKAEVVGDEPEESEEQSVEPTPPSAESPKQESVKSSEEKSVESSSESVESPPKKKIDFEITNPDDIDIDDKGQLGLF